MTSQLQRHGARYPDVVEDTRLRPSIEKLQSANVTDDPRLAFLKDYSYSLGVDDLVPLGALQCVFSDLLTGLLFFVCGILIGGGDLRGPYGKGCEC